MSLRNACRCVIVGDMMQDDFSWKEVGSRIRALRVARSMQQTVAAERAGLSQSAFARVESGGREPQLATLAKIAAALDVSIRELLTAEADERRHSRVHAEVNAILDSRHPEAIAAFNQGLQLASLLAGRSRSATVRLRRKRSYAVDVKEQSAASRVHQTVAAPTAAFKFGPPSIASADSEKLAGHSRSKISVRLPRKHADARDLLEKSAAGTVLRTVGGGTYGFKFMSPSTPSAISDKGPKPRGTTLVPRQPSRGSSPRRTGGE